jgi:hypothetical protein
VGRDKHVVTANKALLGKYVDDVIALCEAHPSVRLGFEAAVAGGVGVRVVVSCDFRSDCIGITGRHSNHSCPSASYVWRRSDSSEL